LRSASTARNCSSICRRSACWPERTGSRRVEQGRPSRDAHFAGQPAQARAARPATREHQEAVSCGGPSRRGPTWRWRSGLRARAGSRRVRVPAQPGAGHDRKRSRQPARPPPAAPRAGADP
jgi:hypothetical protein